MARLLFPAKLLFAALAAFVVWQGWVFLRPSPRGYTNSENAAIRRLCHLIVERVSHESPGVRAVGVAHFLNDPSDGFTTCMREAATGNPDWRVEDTSIIQRFLADISTAVKNATSLDEIANAGHRVGIDIVIAGKVIATRETGDGAEARASVIAYDVKEGKALLNETLAATWKPSFGSRLGSAVVGMNPFLRSGVWLLLALLLPVVTPFATHWAVERKSNAASFGLLAAYTVTDIFLALLLSGFKVQGPVKALMLCLALAGCGAYNFWICERIAGSSEA